MYSHHSNDSAEGAFQALRKHDEYYLPGGDLFFLIEQNHFRVHRYFFERESPFFKAQLATPASPGASRQGTSESTAIVLNDVKSADFAKFLWVFYNPKYSLYHARVEDWVAILELAHRWGFAEVKALVIREIERLYMTDIHRVVVYHKYDIDRRLLLNNYAALVAREEPLTLQEGMELGMDTTLKIFRAREVARATPTAGGVRSPKPVTMPPGEMRNLVKDLFEISEDGFEPASSPVEETKPVETKPVKPTNGMNGTTTGKNGTTANVTANGPKNAESSTTTTKPVTGSTNADNNSSANGTPEGVKGSTTAASNGTTSNGTASNTATSKPNVVGSRLTSLFEPPASPNGSAEEKKTETEDDKKSGTTNDTEAAKEKEIKDEPSTPSTPRPETPSGTKTGKGGKGGKKTPWGL